MASVKQILFALLALTVELSSAQTAITKLSYEYVAINCVSVGQKLRLVGNELIVVDGNEAEQHYRHRIPLSSVSMVGIAVRRSPYPFKLQCSRPGCIHFEYIGKDWYDVSLKVKSSEPVNDFDGACIPPNGINALNDLVNSLGGNRNHNPYDAPIDLSKKK